MTPARRRRLQRQQQWPSSCLSHRWHSAVVVVAFVVTLLINLSHSPVNGFQTGRTMPNRLSTTTTRTTTRAPLTTPTIQQRSSNRQQQQQRLLHRLFLSSNEKRQGGSARFTGVEEATSGLDFVLSAITSDIGSIGLGLVGLLVVLVNRLAHQDNLSADTLGQETRSDLLALFACGAVLLNGVTKLDVTSALAESVVLDGILLDEPEVLHDNDQSSLSELRWAMESLLTATPAKTAVLLRHDESVDGAPLSWKTFLCAGVVPAQKSLRTGTALPTNPILDRFVTNTAGPRTETYLPTLQALPGRVEFTYLPNNTQEALLLPVNDKTVLVLGSNTAKSFTPRDVAWCQVVAKRMDDCFFVDS